MTEALQLGFAYVVRVAMVERIPQEEIDREARQLIADHGANALSVAQGHVQRSQWSKGRSDKIERSKRVLKAVEKSAFFTHDPPFCYCGVLPVASISSRYRNIRNRRGARRRFNPHRHPGNSPQWD